MKQIVMITFGLLFCIFQVGAQTVTTIAGTGVGGYSGDDSSCLIAELNSPDAVKFDRAGNMYIPDEYNSVIRKINTAGIITTIAGTGIHGHTGDNGPATAAELYRPEDLIFDAFGNIYIGEYGNKDIRKIDTFGIITTIAGTGGGVYNGDNIPATAANLHAPAGLCFNSNGNLIFSDNGTYRIRKIDTTTGIITTIAGTGSAGYTGDGGPATSAQIRLSCYLAFNAKGELYIPDYSNYVLRVVDTAGIINTVAGTGIMGYTGDGGPASAATLTSAFAILFDHTGNIYLSDRVLGVIRKIDTSGIINTIAGIGTLGYGGDGGPATAAQFNEDMYCSAIDAAGNLYIADPINNRIRKITMPLLTTRTGGPSPSVDSRVNIYPNPASNQITINVASLMVGTITIANLVGQKVLTQEYHGNSVTIDVADLPKGLYFVSVNGIMGSIKMIKL
jgi:Secretion system C-terminal sorting domain